MMTKVVHIIIKPNKNKNKASIILSYRTEFLVKIKTIIFRCLLERNIIVITLYNKKRFLEQAIDKSPTNILKNTFVQKVLSARLRFNRFNSNYNPINSHSLSTSRKKRFVIQYKYNRDINCTP